MTQQTDLLIENTSYASFVNKVDSLDWLTKATLYMQFYIRIASSKHWFKVVDKEPYQGKMLPKYRNHWQHGWGTPDKEFRGIAFYYLWKNYAYNAKPSKEYTLSDFTSRNNITIKDLGEDWECQGYAQRYKIDFDGIYRECYFKGMHL